MKGLRATTIVKEIKLKGVLGKLESKARFQSALREKFKFYFSRVFARIDKIFTFSGTLGTWLSFYEV